MSKSAPSSKEKPPASQSRPEITKLQSRVHTRILIQTGSTTQSKTFVYKSDPGACRLVPEVGFSLPGGNDSSIQGIEETSFEEKELDYLAEQLGLLSPGKFISNTPSPRGDRFNLSKDLAGQNPNDLKLSLATMNISPYETLSRRPPSVTSPVKSCPSPEPVSSSPPDTPLQSQPRRRSKLLSNIIRTFSLHHKSSVSSEQKIKSSRRTSVPSSAVDITNSKKVSSPSSDMPLCNGKATSVHNFPKEEETTPYFQLRHNIGQRLYQSMRSFHRRSSKSSNITTGISDTSSLANYTVESPNQLHNIYKTSSSPTRETTDGLSYDNESLNSTECATPTPSIRKNALKINIEETDNSSFQHSDVDDSDKTPTLNRTTPLSFEWKGSQISSVMGKPSESSECPSYIPISLSAYGYGRLMYKTDSQDMISISSSNSIANQTMDHLPHPIKRNKLHHLDEQDHRKTHSAYIPPNADVTQNTQPVTLRSENSSRIRVKSDPMDRSSRQVANSLIVMQVTHALSRQKRGISPNCDSQLHPSKSSNHCEPFPHKFTPENVPDFAKDGYFFLQLVGELEDELNTKIQLFQSWLDDPNECEKMNEEGQGHLLAAIGKARLLVQDKFLQFRELCNENVRHNVSTGDAFDRYPTLTSDLEGFWEMMHLQVNDIRQMFGLVESMHSQDWNVNSNAFTESLNPMPSADEKRKVYKTSQGITRNNKRLSADARKRVQAAKMSIQSSSLRTQISGDREGLHFISW